MAAIVSISMGGVVLLCLLVAYRCAHVRRAAASGSPSSSDVTSEVPREVPGERGAVL